MAQAGTLDSEKSQFTERPARPDDTLAAVDLIYLPMGHLADYLFGNDNSDKAKDALRKLFVREQNRFSYRFADVIEVEGRVGGLLLSYSAATLSELAIPTGKEMAEVLGAGGMARMIKRSAGFMRHNECQSDEYYVFTVAVSPDHQNNGIGKQLLAMAQRKAIEARLAKISLGVTLNNHAAVRFYSRSGFEIVETVKMAWLARLIDYPGYHKMVAKLPLIGVH
jgi:ribosomal protein S18 acetylase RimI-like enzyme